MSKLKQLDLFEKDTTRSLLDQLLSDSKIYKQGKDYNELLKFVVRLRNFAPFNAMLLQVQKPGLSYAASARDWRERFGRWPKDGARPLLILWPFGPVALVYDVMDTEGRDLPEDVSSFFAAGLIDNQKIISFVPLVEKKNIEWHNIDAGDHKAGAICILKSAKTNEEATIYRMTVNRNHSSATQFATIAHELGHLFLGHLGKDKKLNIPKRPKMGMAQRELEAESVAYLVCERNGVKAKSESYLTNYVNQDTEIDDIDIYQVMRAAGQIESLLALTVHTKYDKPT